MKFLSPLINLGIILSISLSQIYDPETGEGAKITIYTLTGEKVYSWNVADQLGQEPGDDGYNTWWDLRSINNQEVAPGLYLYTVEFEGQSSVGKFAIVR